VDEHRVERRSDGALRIDVVDEDEDDRQPADPVENGNAVVTRGRAGIRDGASSYSALNYCEVLPPGSSGVRNRVRHGLLRRSFSVWRLETLSRRRSRAPGLAARGPLEQADELVGQRVRVEILRDGIVRGERQRQPLLVMIDEPTQRIGQR